MNGIDAMRRILERAPSVRVIALTASVDEAARDGRSASWSVGLRAQGRRRVTPRANIGPLPPEESQERQGGVRGHTGVGVLPRCSPGTLARYGNPGPHGTHDRRAEARRPPVRGLRRPDALAGDPRHAGRAQVVGRLLPASWPPAPLNARTLSERELGGRTAQGHPGTRTNRRRRRSRHEKTDERATYGDTIGALFEVYKT